GQLKEDLVVAERLDDRLGHAEAVDAPIDDAPRAVVVVDHVPAGRDLLGPQAQDQLRAALEVEPQVGLDLLVVGVVAEAEADPGAVERERELVLRDVDEHREERDERDEPRTESGHGQILGAGYDDCCDLIRSRASRISRSKAVSAAGASSPAATWGVGGSAPTTGADGEGA